MAYCVVTPGISRFGIWKPPTRICRRLQNTPRIARTDAATTPGVVRSFGTTRMATETAMSATCVQKTGESAPEVSIATTSVPSPPKYPLVSRSQA